MKESVKVQTYCPKDAADDVRIAIGKAGGGIIGNYSHCAFLSSGHGYFMPMEGSTPTLGTQGKVEKVEEMKIEFVCEREKLRDVIVAIKRAHPYEEALIEVLPILEPD